MGVCLASGGLPELALAGSRVAEADKQRRDPKQFISNQRGITLRFSYLSSLSMLQVKKTSICIFTVTTHRLNRH